MAGSTITGSIYIQVIEDVIEKVRGEFVKDGGPGEGVLHELQGIWEMKLLSAKVPLPTDRSTVQKQAVAGSGVPVHDLNVPYEGTGEDLDTPTPGMTPTAEMLFGSLQTPVPTPLPGTVDSSTYNIPTGLSDYSTPLNDGGSNVEEKGGRPSPYMQTPSPWSNQRTPLSVDVNVAYVEGRDEVDRGTSHQPLTQDFFTMSAGKRKREDFAAQYHNGGYIPQQDGAGDGITEKFEVSRRSNVLGEVDSVTSGNGDKLPCSTRSTSKIPQVDGPIPDPYEDMLSTPNIYNYQGAVHEDYNITTPAPDLQAATPAPVIQNDAPDDDDDDDDEPLNENDDDDDLDDVDQGEEQNTQHLVLAQFDKVTRTKSRWKCTLKDGIVHINNRDILFNKATGEFDF